MRFPSSDKKPLYSRNFHKATDDPIGNRTSADSYETGSQVTSTYTTNNLNQYTNITNPTQSPTYDDDGNCTSADLQNDGTWDFTWNAENRLVEAVKTDDAKLEFKYDYMGRRVEKKVYSWVSSTWQLDTHLKFVYNGYKQIEELDGADSDAIEKKYVWTGENLLSVTDADLSATYYFFADINKNIVQLIDSSGNIKAKYEYSPFGKTTLSSGTYASHNPFRFSSEFEDGETGLVYYNFRYYNALFGKWLSREPMGEHGSLNLYSMAFNNPIFWWDYLGLDPTFVPANSSKGAKQAAEEATKKWDNIKKSASEELKKAMTDLTGEVKVCCEDSRARLYDNKTGIMDWGDVHFSYKDYLFLHETYEILKLMELSKKYNISFEESSNRFYLGAHNEALIFEKKRTGLDRDNGGEFYNEGEIEINIKDPTHSYSVQKNNGTSVEVDRFMKEGELVVVQKTTWEEIETKKSIDFDSGETIKDINIYSGNVKSTEIFWNRK